MIEFSNTAPPITEADLLALEQYAGLTFPAAYRAHLLQYNGGECYPADFDYQENGVQVEGMIEAFLPLADDEAESLKAYIDIYKLQQKRLPNRMLPIAFDPGGSLICLSCAGADAGAVFFWDVENEVDYSVEPDSNQANLHWLQASLPAFLATLREEDDDWSFINEK